MPTDTPVLMVDGLSLSFSGRSILKNFSLQTPSQPARLGLLGGNGCGKSTLFRCIAGLQKPDQGRILLNGINIQSMSPHERSRAGLGYLAQEPWLFQQLSCKNNLLAVAQLAELNKPPIEELLQRFRLSHIENTPASKLSGGEKRRLELARLFLTHPKLLLLDEPFSGLDPRGADELEQMLSELLAQGLQILICDHYIERLVQTCDQLLLMHEGSIVLNEKTAVAQTSPLLSNYYMGLPHGP